MPWHKVQNHNECPANQPWAVVKDDDGSVAGCHSSESSADSQLAALYANEGDMTTKIEYTPIASHSTATDDEGSWDAAGALSRMNTTEANLRAMHARRDPDGNPEAQSSYGFPHHNVNANGSVGAANTSACSTGIAAINGGRGGHSLDPAEKQGVYNHLARHLRDAGKEPPPLKGGTGAAATASITAAAPDSDAIAAAVANALNVETDAVEVEVDGSDVEVETETSDGTVSTTHTINDDGSVDSQTSSGDTPAAGSPEAAQIKAVEAALKAAAAPASPAPGPPSNGNGGPPSSASTANQANVAFSMPVMVIEGAWTGDYRFIEPGCLTWRELPLPLMALTTTTETHEGAELVGRIDRIERQEMSEDDFNARLNQPYAPGTTKLVAHGVFDTSDKANEISRLVNDKFLRGISADLGDAVSEIVFIDADGNEVEDDEGPDLFDILFGGSEDGLQIGEKVTDGRLMGATVCPFPAFEGAFIEIGEVAMAASAGKSGIRLPSINFIPSAGKRGKVSLVAGGAPMVPPSEWFIDPQFNEATPITIDSGGKIFGHLAVWHECHMGYSSQCVKPPHSMSEYAYYHTGCTLTSDGDMVPTGVITMNTGHAELWQNADSAKAHYDNTGTVVADVCAGEDPFGIWVSGAMRPDVDQLTTRRMRGAALSGDWRTIGGNLELVAALAVNVPGFAVKRPKARVASGVPQSLVAAGRLTHKDAEKLHTISAGVGQDALGIPKRDMQAIAQFMRDQFRSNVHGGRSSR